MKLKEVRSNSHQQHLESLILFGKDGINEINYKIENFINRFKDGNNNLITTTKIDGSPSLFVWSHIDGYPDNSIALKGFVNGPQTAMSSEKEIDDKYGDRPDMADKLKWGLKLAKYVPKGEAWQGDCLFTQPTLEEREINGKDYLTFQPNKIIYAFSEENPGYNQVKNADFGIAFHTIYKKSGDSLQQSFRVDPTKINVPNNFYILSPAINASNNHSDYSVDEIVNIFNKLKEVENKLLNDPAYEQLINNKTFINYWNTFENKMLADNKAVNINVNTLIDDLTSYINDKLEKEYNKKISALKTDDAKLRASDKYNKDLEELNNLLQTNKETLKNIVTALNLTADIKMLMWNGFKKAKQDYSTFYKSKTKGYFTADPEGIAMSDDDGNIVKLVDRSAFSSYNRDSDIESGWEHKNEDVNMNIKEMAATQMSDMGSFGKFTKLLLDEDDDNKKVAVVAGGRLNPPTIGHSKLIDLLVSIGNKYGVKPKLFLTHTANDPSNPLSYESKIRWVKKAFGDKVDIVETNARTILQYLQELYNEGYTDLVYAGSDDRIGGVEDISNIILKYNGQPDKNGNIIYNFNSINFDKAGKRSNDSEDLVERTSATLARKYVVQNDFEHFKEIVPFNESDAKKLFKELRYALTGANENLVETTLKKKDYTPYVRKQLDKALDKIDKKLDAPDPNMGANEYKANIDKYTGLLTKQTSQDSNNTVVYSERDIPKLFPNNYDEILRRLDSLEVEDEEGNEYSLASTGTSVLNSKGFDSTETTVYQEAISGLILGNRIKTNDIKKYLLESDPEKGSGIFKQINANTSAASFKQNWVEFINKWGTSFETEFENRGEFENVANSILSGNINKAVILHPGINNNYSKEAGILLAGADKFDKSDVYFCTGNVSKIIKDMLSFRSSNDILGYVNYMVNHSSEIIGVSLKKVGKSMRVQWDIPAKKPNFFDDKVYFPASQASSQALVFRSKDGKEEFILSIRSNSKSESSKGTIEWREKGGSAMMGKAGSTIERFFGSEFAKQLSDSMKARDYVKSCKLLFKNITGVTPKPGDVSDMTKEGKARLTKMFNAACGFDSTDDSGNRVSAPYIKVY